MPKNGVLFPVKPEQSIKKTIIAGIGLLGVVAASQAAAQVTFYEQEGFRGRSFTATQRVDNLNSTGFNDRASSAIVERGEWQVCEDAFFHGRCSVLRPGQYP